LNFQIKQITEDDWRVFSRIRLRALQTDPNVFGSNYEREAGQDEEVWKETLRSPTAAIFIIYADETPAGMTAIAVDRNDPTGKTALLWGSWLAPEYRGKGLSKMMYDARLEWAKAQPTVERIIVSHRASNTASKHANQKHGFKFTHAQEKHWIDGKTEDEVFYELKLKP
jgi:RimJ/RimL family protein N-acetyltransferase